MSDEPYPWPDSENIIPEDDFDKVQSFAQEEHERQMRLLREYREVQTLKWNAIAGIALGLGFLALVGWVAWLWSS